MNPPVVSVNGNATVLLNESIQVADLFSVSDADGDAITSYEFTDLDGNPLSGQLRLAGVLQNNGSQLTIDANQLGTVSYVGARNVRNEGIRIRAFDGTSFSAPRTVRIFSTNENNTRPVFQSEDASVLGNEFIQASSFLTASDPDGFPIARYFLRDRLVDNSFFSLDGEALEQGEYHFLSPAEFSRLRYEGFGSGVDIVDAFAFDGVDWTVAATQRITTIGNVSAPAVQFNRTAIGTSRTANFADLVNVFDADGNSIKTIDFFDTGVHDFTGSIVFDGQRLPSRVWHSFSFSELSDVTYIAGERTHDEQIRVRVSDGRFRSRNETIVFETTESPEAGSDRLVELDHITFIPLRELFDQLDNGSALTEFEVIELGGVTGDPTGYLVGPGGGRVATGQLQTLTPVEFNNTGFISGAFASRATDELLIRASNSQGPGDWTRITLRTEPAISNSMLQQVAFSPVDYTDWTDFLPLLSPGSPNNQITFSFMQNFPLYDPPGEGGADNFFVLTEMQRENVRFALNSYSNMANVTFVEVADDQIDQDTFRRGGLIRVGSYAMPISNILGYAFFPGLAEQSGDIFMNIGLLGDFWEPGTPGYETLVHELGHAMGFEHPFGPASQAPFLPDSTQTSDFTVMANAPSQNGAPVGAYQLYDINQMQRLYGANESFRTGDDFYNIGGFYNGADSVVSIWDAGGTDTLSAAGSEFGNLAGGAVLDLREGSRNSIGSFNENISIAYGSVIENAVGTLEADNIRGNAFDNLLEGDGGNDLLFGAGGNDTLMGGAGSDTYIFGIADGRDVISENGQAGRDTVQISSDHPALNNFEQDLLFRRDGLDLVIDLTLDGESTLQSLRIENQRWGAWQVESLEIGSERVDLTDVYDKATSVSQSFRVTGDSSVFGNLVVPL